jgi:hypothetical protein
MNGAAASAGAASIAGVGIAASMVPAYIQSTDPSLPLPPINFPYNPEKFQITHSAKWGSITHPSADGPVKQFQGVSTQAVTVMIMLDQFSVPPPLMPITAIIQQIKMFLLPTELSKTMGYAKAATVVFGWGPNIIMDQAIITKVVVEYQRFLLGMPVRANVQVTLEAVPLPSPLGGTNPTSGGVSTRRMHTVTEGDTLASVAYREYRDPNKWRVLAEANGIDDPMRIKPGTDLIVPSPKDVDAYQGQD